ncbi:MAG: hypothetical protein ABS44_02360 [Chryseobacterium sp. SCN 40-13]|nr:MAG: hypothetical protein ABS44_02360 [Chryseobacterium sp. SCN 40-13]
MKIKVLISILALLYILFIIVMWQFQLIIPGVAGIIFGALYEMTVIPVFFLVPVLTVLFGVLWIREGFKKKIRISLRISDFFSRFTIDYPDDYPRSLELVLAFRKAFG